MQPKQLKFKPPRQRVTTRGRRPGAALAKAAGKPSGRTRQKKAITEDTQVEQPFLEDVQDDKAVGWLTAGKLLVR